MIAFYVDGTSIPEVDWDIGPSWAGLLPISGNEDETRQVSKVSKYSIRVLNRTVVLLVLPTWAYGESRFVDGLDERRSRMFFA